MANQWLPVYSSSVRFFTDTFSVAETIEKNLIHYGHSTEFCKSLNKKGMTLLVNQISSCLLNFIPF